MFTGLKWYTVAITGGFDVVCNTRSHMAKGFMFR
jgi:hypothetical protein